MRDIFSNIEQQIENIDEKIEAIMKNATDSKNYEKLNQKINDVFNHSAGAFEKGYEKAEQLVKERSEQFKTSVEVQQEKIKKHHQAFKKTSQKQLFAKKDGVYAGGMALVIIGYILAGLLGIGILVMLILATSLSVVPFLAIARFILGPLFIIFFLMAMMGTVMTSKFKRFKKYVQVLGGHEQAEVSELARSIGKSNAFIRKDLKKMIARNWFKEGYLTHDETTLMVSKAAYEAYQMDQQRTQEEEQRLFNIQQMHEQLPVQARATIQKGEDFIKEIHEKKVAISEYEMTIKLSQLESILKKIFKRVEKHPEVVPAMRKMMDYYLPTTIKLLEVYAQLDKQAANGVNILSAKSEIEASLDTLIGAYEKLLDDLFEDVMLDVSTDITVLNTMLAQDGLTNDEFAKMNKKGAE